MDWIKPEPLWLFSPRFLATDEQFSTTQGGFGDLSNANFFDRIKDDYGDAIYAFDHYTVSVTPERNALDLPSGGITCDVTTHSRGGLVLRNLVERKDKVPREQRPSA